MKKKLYNTPLLEENIINTIDVVLSSGLNITEDIAGFDKINETI